MVGSLAWLLGVALVLAGCGTTGALTTGPASAPVKSPAQHARKRPPAKRSRAGILAYSNASNDVVHAEPAAGSCHAIGSGPDTRPDPGCTPGALNPAVTQQTIEKTICVAGWTATVRPRESITEREKAASMAAYGDAGSLSDYEYDHFVPLELGGATNDRRNLWPEPGGSPNAKDVVESDLRAKVCDGQMTLRRARHAIVSNWSALAGRPPASSSSQAAHCTATASYNARYHDYDVYVRSNQPDRAVTVSDSEGDSDSWHTDSTGYADVFFKTGGSAAGRQVRVRVGGASCITRL